MQFVKYALEFIFFFLYWEMLFKDISFISGTQSKVVRKFKENYAYLHRFVVLYMCFILLSYIELSYNVAKCGLLYL